MADSDEDYYLPLQDQRVFGAGIKRKRINFVPASTGDQPLPANTGQPTDIGNRYLSIVLPKSQPESPDTTSAPTSGVLEKVSQQHLNETVAQAVNETPKTTSDLCSICAQPMTKSTNNSTETTHTAHESSIAHQFCLTHSHPPSHLPRDHVGVRYLTAHGWDPDSRLGLGAKQEGISVPIKAREKHDTVGLREKEDEDAVATRKKKAEAKKESKVVKLNAKELKARDIEARRRAEKLRANFYGPDLEQYLRTDADNLPVTVKRGKPR
ncbi:hypothetical protein H2200_011194 [Cladophialophora chaetospira]|uniref:G-patch domain-containing protein n=1 Tax=Cladophialophora chaetospira TaxID=386627 RepID=A0AA38X065_9EURO|nr:hypothetical protein H2200_011194 [Cladophialophora chaetospira]